MLPKAEVSSRHWGCARDCLHADAAIGVSYHDVAGTNTMTETVAVDRPLSRQAYLSTAIQKACDRQRVGIGAAPIGQQWQNRQGEAQGAS